MGDTLGIGPPGAGFELGLTRAVRHQGDETTERALGRAEQRELAQVTPEIRLGWRGRGDLILVEEVQEPLHGGALGEWVIDMAEGLEAQARAAEVVPAAFQQIGEESAMAVEVKEFRLRMRILQPLRSEHIPEGALAGAGGAQHEKVAEIARVIDHAKQGGVLRMGIEPRPATQVPIALRARPRRRQART